MNIGSYYLVGFPLGIIIGWTLNFGCKVTFPKSFEYFYTTVKSGLVISVIENERTAPVPFQKACISLIIDHDILRLRLNDSERKVE